MICFLPSTPAARKAAAISRVWAASSFGILRLGDGVQVDHAIEAFVVVLQAREVADRAEIVAEVEIAGRLHAGQDAALEAAGGVGREMRVGQRLW